MPAIARRPGIVTFVAVVFIVVGCLALLGGVCGGGLSVVGMLQADDGKPARPEDFLASMGAAHRAIAKEAPGYDAYMVVGILSYLFFGVAGIVLGIGILKLNSLARKLAIALTIFQIICFFASQAYSVAYVFPAQTKFQKEQLKMLPNGGDAAAAVELGSKVGLGIGLGCGFGVELTLVLLILIGLNTQSAKKAFGGIPADTQAEDDDDDSRHGIKRGDPRAKYEGYEEHDE